MESIEDLVEALKVKYPWVVRDTEAIKLGDKLRKEMMEVLEKNLHEEGKLIGHDLDGKDLYQLKISTTTDEIEMLQKKLTLLEASLKLTGILNDLVERLPPEEEGNTSEAGAAVRKHRQRKKIL